jgi:TolB-like protein
MPDPLAAFQSAVADRYAIEGRLGEGGMAIVFLANDLRHHRAVAVKVLRPEFAAVLGPERFLREINFAAELNHPHIVPLFDSGVVPAAAGHPALPYYVMPRLKGETLRERIAREGALPIDEAVDIARQVAQALAYAHAQGIIHRDIKPANILLSDGEAVVADFGIARALDRAGEVESITDSGLTLGTPAYMAPEQTTGDTQLDGRADIYALGCVLYEMLGGSPPFSGATAAAVIARHRTDAPPSLRTLRSTVSPQLEAVVLRALAKSPADRFPDATGLVRALTPGSGSFPAIEIQAQPRRRAPYIAAAGAVAAVALAVWAGTREPRTAAASFDVASVVSDASLDTTLYAVIPFEYEADIPRRFNEMQLFTDALSRWEGISLVAPAQLRRADTSAGAAPPDADASRAAAIRLRAGRLVRGQVSLAGSTLRISAQLVESGTDRVLARHATRVDPALADAESIFIRLADSLVLPRPTGEDEGGHDATSSLPAHQSFAAGRRAIQTWDLTGAIAHFSAASDHDPEYAQALLWTAVTRAWSGAGPTQWQSPAERAVARAARLSERDRAIAEATVAMARGDLVRACRRWAELTEAYPNDFVVWYGEGDCQARDNTVLRDQLSPSGWRFRTSSHSAMRAYRRALQLQPSIHEGLVADAFEPISHLLKLRPTSVRFGDGPGGRSFAAQASWDGDSLAFTPYALNSLRSPPRLLEAIQHQRELFHEIATAWTVALPRSSTALEALAFSSELLGQRDALTLLQRAGRLATDPRDRFRISARQTWIRVRLAAPGNLRELESARHTADSLLSSPEAAVADPRIYASLSVLLGRGNLAVRAFGDPRIRSALNVPTALFPSAPQLVLLAALGAPGDTLRQLEQRLLTSIDRSLPPDARPQARLQWIARAATLAYPTARLASSPTLSGKGDYLLDAQETLHRGDSAAARHALLTAIPDLPSGRFAERPADAVLPEAWLMAKSGDVPSAIGWLDQLLGSLYEKAPRVADEPIEAASLLRAMVLRAELGSATGDDSDARKWAGVVALLWSEADAWLQPLVGRMKALSR